MEIRKVHISVVSPVYRAENVVEELVDRIEKALSVISDNYEIILVDDRSTDNSWQKIIEISQRNEKVKGYRFSKNFGQHHAITAGLDHAVGEWVVVMDCDLQDQPEEIINLYNKAREGFDGVLARRFDRKDHFFKRLFSKLFYRTLGYLTGSKQDETIANFGIYNHKIIAQIKLLRESIRYFPTMVRWVGFNVTHLNVEHSSRNEGKSNYKFINLVNLAIDILLTYSDKPIRLVIRMGFAISLISFLFIIITLFRWLNHDIQVIGYSSLIISIWFLSGILLMTLGVIGLYVGKTFEGVKNRPLYIIDSNVND